MTSSYGSEPNFKIVRELGEEVIPYFLEAYPSTSKWQQRASFLYHSIHYARTSRDAYALALLALKDRSREVRYRACMLLACAQNPDAIENLTSLLTHGDKETREDAAAAIDALESGNHHFFVDRDHSGRVTLNFQGSQDDA